MAKRKTAKETGNEVKQTPGAFGNAVSKNSNSGSGSGSSSNSSSSYSSNSSSSSNSTTIEGNEDGFGLENIDVQETYSKAEKFINNNKGIVFGSLALIFLIVGGYYFYTNVYKPPIEAKASLNASKAQEYFGIDSFNLALNGDGNYDGFLDIADNYGSTKMGNLANYYAGVCYLNMKSYDDAIDYLQKFNGDDMVVSSMAIGAIGDAYMQKGNNAEGMSYYEKAINNSDNNFTAPMYHYKAAIAKVMNKDFTGAKAHLNAIKNNYPESAQATDAAKYLSKIAAK